MVCALCVSVSGQAATVSYGASGGGVPSSLTDWSTALSFQKFDSSLGTLNSVKLDLNSAMSTVITVTNNGVSPSNGTANTRMRVYVQDAGPNLISPAINWYYSDDFLYNLPTGGGVTSDTLTGSGSSSHTYSTAPVLTEFTGSGLISLAASTYTETVLANNGGNTSANQLTNANLGGMVTYDYTPAPVPEPATIAAIASGAAALGFLFMRRRMKKTPVKTDEEDEESEPLFED